MKKYEKYIETTEFPNNTHIEVSVYYDKGGINFYNGNNDRRGFYLSVTPVKKDAGFVSILLGSGLKKLILTTGRYSEKQHDIAIEKSKELEPILIESLKARRKSA